MSLLFGGAEFIQYVAALAVLPKVILKRKLHQDFLEEKDEFIIFTAESTKFYASTSGCFYREIRKK